MPKKISDHFPSKENKKVEFVAVQGYVPGELRESVLEKMKQEKNDGKKVTWDILLEGCLRQYLDE